MSIDQQKRLKNQKAEIFRHSDFDRQKAIASWPLMVFNVARTMNSIMSNLAYFSGKYPDDKIQQSLDTMEKQIRESFIETFGHDMIPTQGLMTKEGDANNERG